MTPGSGKDSAMGRWMWTGRSYDLGKMSFRDLAVAYSTYYAIHAYLIVAIVSGAVAIHVADSWSPALLGAAAALSAGLISTCVYEFGHCIQHLNYKPRSAFLKQIKRWHLAHHFHSERGNFGIMSFIPDRLFGTWYDAARDVPRSATTFNLGYDRAEAARYPFVAELTGALPLDRPPPAGEAEVGQTAATELWLPRRQSSK
jgi:sterol desaturase/sphingolipid hydroxylase (fatty acid hydroxylase superfamily)